MGSAHNPPNLIPRSYVIFGGILSEDILSGGRVQGDCVPDSCIYMKYKISDIGPCIYFSYYARKQNASRVFAIVWASVCLSVCSSVCHTRRLYQNDAS